MPRLTPPPLPPPRSHATGHGASSFVSPRPVQVAQLPLSLSDGRWHHICITWTTRDGFWEAYQDGERLGTGDNLAPWHPIKSGGVIILGQEQVRAARRLRQSRVSMCALAPACLLPWASCWRHREHEVPELFSRYCRVYVTFRAHGSCAGLLTPAPRSSH